MNGLFKFVGIILLTSSVCFSQTKYEISIDEGLKKLEEGQPLIVFVTATWCGSCQIMKRDVVNKLTEPYVILDLDKDIETVKKLTDKMQVPQLIIYYKLNNKYHPFKEVGSRPLNTIINYIKEIKIKVKNAAKNIISK